MWWFIQNYCRTTHPAGGQSWYKVNCTSETAANQSHPPPPGWSRTDWGLNPLQRCSLLLKKRGKVKNRKLLLLYYIIIRLSQSHYYKKQHLKYHNFKRWKTQSCVGFRFFYFFWSWCSSGIYRWRASNMPLSQKEPLEASFLSPGWWGKVHASHLISLVTSFCSEYRNQQSRVKCSCSAGHIQELIYSGGWQLDDLCVHVDSDELRADHYKWQA